ncbi:MAG: DUF1674 domain-containing protein [Bdellovibrionales bacterium]
MNEPKSPPFASPADASEGNRQALLPRPREIGGVQGPEPTRYGDWEHKGRCADF